MDIIDIIIKQKNGIDLSDSEIEYLINGYTQGIIPDYQMSAYLMALCFTGANEKVISKMTMCMANSGDILNLSGISGTVLDKHSTGGVGDKTTLVVGPCVAACGGKVAKMSGRGLGYTGGTIDKLESIKNFNTQIPVERFIDIINEIGISIVGQLKNLAPADKKIYSLRDVTGTVDCIPLIASSIMSKKIASGANAIVLDVKYGSGAFMKTEREARELAELMVRIAKAHGKKVTALLTDMDCPLGNAVGNSLEVVEAVECLQGRAPEDYTLLTTELAAQMLFFAEKGSLEECRVECEKAVESGAAFRKFKEMVAAQGGNTAQIEDTSLFPKAKYSRIVRAETSGYISRIDTELYGTASVLLGAGRLKKEDVIDPTAGIRILKKTGDRAEAGDGIAVLFASDEALFEPAQRVLSKSIVYSSVPPEKRPLILGVID